MTDPAREPWRALAWFAAAAACTTGLFDVVRGGAGLSSFESLQSVTLWLLLSVPIWGTATCVALLRKTRTRSTGTTLIAAMGPSIVVLALVHAALAPALRRLGAQDGMLIALVGVALAATLFLAWRAERSRSSVRTGFLATGSLLVATALLGFRSTLPELETPAAETSDRGQDRPNVVLIVLDTLRSDHVGAYGHPGGLTPNLDRFAATATLYENAFASAPWTVPSHATLFTGLAPKNHRASFDHAERLAEGFTTLAEALGRAGYRTAAFSANRWLEIGNLAQGFDVFENTGAPFVRSMLRPVLQVLGGPSKWMDHGAQHTVERTTAFLAGAVGEKEPLFLFINLLEPHWRYLPPLLDRLALLPEGIDVLAATWTSTQMYGPLLMAGKPSRGPTLEVVRAFYAAAVRYQDRRVGELLKRIDATLGAENTLVIITADHGENLGEAGRWDHVFAINDHLLRVPLTIRLPAHFPAGLRVAEACGLIDIPATVADLVPELDFPTGAGRTLVPQHLRPREFVFAEGDPFRLHRERMSAYASPEQLDTLFASLVTAQSSRFKYQRSTAAEPMLFDLDSDPDESNNVLENWPEEAATLVTELDRWLADTGPAPEDSEDPTTLRDEDLEALRELGYIGNP